jgi:hypothetical protein
MAESGLDGLFWFSSTMYGVICRNATYRERLGTTPLEILHGKKEGCDPIQTIQM